MPNKAEERAAKKPPQTRRRRPPARSTTPYYVVAVFAAAAMAWYFLFFVPSKLEYFVGLKLRALAVASAQVKTKAENLASALEKAPSGSATEQYLRVLVPEVELDPSGTAPPAGLHLYATTRREVTATVTWDDVATQAAAVSEVDFDDLVFAVASGRVVWQRETTSPRIGNLAQVLHADAAKGGWFSFNWTPRPELPKTDAGDLPGAVAIKPITVGGRPSLLMVQAVSLAPWGIEPLEPKASDVPAVAVASGGTPRDDTDGHTLYVAGMVSLEALQAQAMNVPLAWVLLLSLPVILLFLALPFGKLATLMPRERFSAFDVLLLLLAAFAGASLAATIPLTEISVDEDADNALSQLAMDVNQRVGTDVADALRVAAIIHRPERMERRPCPIDLSNVGLLKVANCDLWSAIDPPTATGARLTDSALRARLDVDVAMWLDEQGNQVAKWTTKTQATGFTRHNRLQHYHDLVHRRLWRLAPAESGRVVSAPDVRFTIDPLRAPTTAELGVVLALELEELKRAAGLESSPVELRSARYFAMNFRPRSLLDTVVAPNYGFAVVGPDGRVLFHSQEELSLEENFFEEVGEPHDVRARAESGHTVTWSGDYHGQPHRLHMQQLSTFQDCPWRLVTFVEMEPHLQETIAHQAGTFRLVAFNLVVLSLIGSAVFIRGKVARRRTRDLVNAKPVTRPEWLAGHVVLLALGVAALVAAHSPGSRHLLDHLYLVFLAMPAAALWVSVRARRSVASDARAGAPTASDGGSAAVVRALVPAELGLLVVLVAGIPAAGMAAVVQQVQNTHREVRWLEQTHQRLTARRASVASRISRPSYGESVRVEDFTGLDDLEKRYAYLTFLPQTVALQSASASRDRRAPDSGQMAVRWLLAWNPFPSKDEAGYPTVWSLPGRLELQLDRSDQLALTISNTRNQHYGQNANPDGQQPATARAGLWPDSFAVITRYSVPSLKLVFGFVLLGATIAAVYWARRKLLAHPPAEAPSLEAVLTSLDQSTKNELIMLIGPPRTGKDGAIDRALAAKHHQVERRIRLLDGMDDSDFVDKALTAILDPRQRQQEPAGMFGADAVSSSPRYIHVSNLESYLVDHDRREQARMLLERLLDDGSDRRRRIIIVTTNVDPIAHFEEIFDIERRGIYDDPIPEVALSRFALLLARVHRCYLPLVADDGGDDPWRHYSPRRWFDVLKWEARATALQPVGQGLHDAWSERLTVSRDELERAIAMRSFALYELLWTSCTRREKLVLAQLAQEGFVSRHSAEVVSALLAKGLIVLRPGPAIFNQSFRVFLQNIERSDVLESWERMDGQGIWVVAGRVIASSMVAGGLFFLLTQGYSVEGLLPILSGTGVFGVPLVRELLARVTGGSSPEVAG